MSQEDIYNVSNSNPIVRAWITTYHYNKDITYVDALEGMVLSLVEQNDELSKEVVKLLSNSIKTLHFGLLRD
jgi:membrane-anchored protein YejM (alkaline phosphatase superfamily)